MRIIGALVVLLCISSVALADLKVTRKAGAGGYSGQSTVYIKGARERTENPGMTTIQQCDLRRTVQINDRMRKYLIVPDSDGETASTPAAKAAAVTAPQSPRQTRRGAIVTHSVNITDTGERKTLFGYTARHIKTTTVMDAPPDACSPGHMEMESDGWYIDLAAGFSCETADRPSAPHIGRERPDCQDQVRFKRTGAGKLGFPVIVTTKFKTGGAGQGDADAAEVSAAMSNAMTNTLEVTDISTVTLDPALFEVPKGYTEVASMQELYGSPSGMTGMPGMPEGTRPSAASEPGEGITMPMLTAAAARPKQPGAIRVGVVPLNNRAGGAAVSLEGLRARLVGSISDANVEAIPLDSSEPAAADAEAKQKECDFVLYTDLSALKQSAAGKMGGMFGRVTGVSTPGAERFESRVDFRLIPVGGSSPQLESNAAAKEEGADASVGAALEREAKAVVAAARKKR